VKSPANNSNALIKNDDALRTIFNRYGSALLGYIFGVVNDHTKAENYLIEIFKHISRFADELIYPEVNTWLRLQQLAKNFLHQYRQPTLSSVDAEFVAPEQSNKCLNLLTAEQKYIFCSIYYGHKTIQSLAHEMRTDEDAIRRRLREALSVIRNGQ
jgi:DNA-directed RNA polymerase specialized sigma24 family protein